MSLWIKDPADVTWFQFNWGTDPDDSQHIPFLDPGETITSYTASVDANLTKVADVNTTTTVSIKVSGGVNGSASLAQCSIQTSNGNTYKAEKTIFIQERVIQ